MNCCDAQEVPQSSGAMFFIMKLKTIAIEYLSFVVQHLCSSSETLNLLCYQLKGTEMINKVDEQLGL